jgi:serine/threonine protein phosphatase PrpC
MSNPNTNYGVYQYQQRGFEDSYTIFNWNDFCYVAVFDGHGSSKMLNSTMNGKYHAAKYASDYLHKRIFEKLSYIDSTNTNLVKNAIVDTFILFDREMLDTTFAGSTATILLIDNKNKYLYQINLGDSRSIIFNKDIMSVTNDHHPNNESEKNRIISAGSFIISDRIRGELAVSRAFGDYQYKNINGVYNGIKGEVSCVPDINILSYSNFDSLTALLTSDAPFEPDKRFFNLSKPGFDTLSLIKLFHKYSQSLSLDLIANNMANEIKVRTTDDITIIIIRIC